MKAVNRAKRRARTLAAAVALAAALTLAMVASQAGCGGPSWSSLVHRLPPADLGAGFVPYHQAVGEALVTLSSRDPRVLIEHGVPYEESDGRKVYQYSWVHFPDPYQGGEPIGQFDTVCHFTIVLEPAPEAGPFLVSSLKVRETIIESDKIEILKSRSEYVPGPRGVGAPPVSFLDRVEKLLFATYLPIKSSFWDSYNRVDWVPGQVLTLPSSVPGASLQLNIIDVRAEPGYSDRTYVLIPVMAQGS